MNRKIKDALFVIGVSITFFIICLAALGRVDTALLIGSIIDLPTLLTILIARYARTNLRVTVWTAINVIAWEMINVDSLAYDNGRFFIPHLIVQGLIAWSVSTRFRKERPTSEDMCQPFFSSRAKRLLGVTVMFVCVSLVVVSIDRWRNNLKHESAELTGVYKGLVGGSTFGASEDLIGSSPVESTNRENRAIEAPLLGGRPSE